MPNYKFQPTLCCSHALQMPQIAVLEGWGLHAAALIISQIVANVLVLLLSKWQDRQTLAAKRSTEDVQIDACRKDDRKQFGTNLEADASLTFAVDESGSIAMRATARSWPEIPSKVRHDTDTSHDITSERGHNQGRSSAHRKLSVELDPGARLPLSWLNNHSKAVERRESLDEPSRGLRYLLSGPEMIQNSGPRTDDSIWSTTPFPSPKWYDFNAEAEDNAWSLVSMGAGSSTSSLGRFRSG